MGPEVLWPNGAREARGARWGGSGPRKKNPFTNRAGFRSRVQTRGSGPGMKNPARTQPVAIPTEAVKMASNSSKQTKSEIEVIEDEASQRWPEGL